MCKDTERNGGNNGAYIGLKEIRSHSGNVTDVVTDIIRDDCGISRVVLRNVVFYLTDEVSAYVRGLRIDTAADTGEKSNGGGSEAVAEEDVRIAGDQINHTYAQKTESDHGESHDSSAVVSDGESFGHTGSAGGVGCANICIRRDAHAEEAGKCREDRADQETYCGDPVTDSDTDDNKEYCRKYDEHLVFREEECIGTFANRTRDLHHAVGSFRLLFDRKGEIDRKQKCTNSYDRNYI